MTLRSIVVSTGAGLSAESGLPTFRGAGGLWNGRRAEDLATPEAFANDPASVLAFYDARRRSLADPSVEPNPAHRALARLQAAWPGELVLITQNVDDLLERAGARALHIHGALNSARCVSCARVREQRGDLLGGAACRLCGGAMRPDVVWFGEAPRHLEEIASALRRCDLFCVIGSSGRVHPAAGFAAEARAHGCAEVIAFDLEPAGGAFDRTILGPASRTVPTFVDQLLATI